jgi:hypothetical protein
VTCMHPRLAGLLVRLAVLGDMSISETGWTAGQNRISVQSVSDVDMSPRTTILTCSPASLRCRHVTKKSYSDLQSSQSQM